MSDQTRFVRSRTGQGVFLKGHGVVGSEGVEVKSSDALDAAIEARVLEETTKPSAKPKANTDKDKEGGQ